MSDLDQPHRGYLPSMPPPYASLAPPPTVPTQRPRQPRTPWVIAGVSVLLAIGGVLFGLGIVPHPGNSAHGGASGSSRATIIMTGSIILTGAPYQDYLPDGNGGCTGTGGYSDMTAGTAVTVADGTGHTLATGSLGTGETPQYGQCVLPITVPGVPAGLAEYTVTVSHRGTQVVPGSQVGVPLQLTLGGN